MEASISIRNRLWIRLIYAVSVFRRFSTRYFGICHFFLRYCGIENPPMSPSISNWASKIEQFHMNHDNETAAILASQTTVNWPTNGVIIYRYVSRLLNFNFYWPLCPTVFCFAYCIERKAQINGTVIPWTILFHRKPSAKMMKNRIPQS